jgi:hypothetical protein
MTNRPSARIVGAICASCIFFVFFFAGVMYLSKLGFVGNSDVTWRISLTSDVTKIILADKEITSVPVHIENLGTETIESTSSENAVFLSFHLLTHEGNEMRYDNDRYALPEPIRKNQQKTVAAVFDNSRLKLKPGNYIIEFDLVKEGEFWFSEKENKTLKIPMTVYGGTE